MAYPYTPSIRFEVNTFGRLTGVGVGFEEADGVRNLKDQVSHLASADTVERLTKDYADTIPDEAVFTPAEVAEGLPLRIDETAKSDRKLLYARAVVRQAHADWWYRWHDWQDGRPVRRVVPRETK